LDVHVGVYLSLGLLGVQTGAALSQGLADFVAVRAALNMRSILVTSVYRHAMTLNSAGRQTLDKGAMVTNANLNHLNL